MVLVDTLPEYVQPPLMCAVLKHFSVECKVCSEYVALQHNTIIKFDTGFVNVDFVSQLIVFKRCGYNWIVSLTYFTQFNSYLYLL